MTLDEWLEEDQEQTIRISTMHHKIIINDDDLTCIVNFESILDRYMSIFEKYLTYVHLTDRQLHEYEFNPKKFSYRIYGTTEWWWMILQLNEMYSGTQFNQKRIRVIKLSALNQFINQIIQADQSIADIYDHELEEQRVAIESS